MVGGLVSLLIFDAAYSVAVLFGTYETGSPIDALELLPFVLTGVAALHPSMAKLSDETVRNPETRLTRRRLALLAVASLTAPSLLVVQWVPRGETIDVPVIVGGSAVLFLLVLVRMAGIMHTREAAIKRERLLRRTAAELVAAPDREGIYEVALEATRELLGDGSRSWVGIAMGSLEEVTVVASTGGNAGEIAGARIYLDEYPDAIRAGLLEGRVVEAESLAITDVSKLEALGFDPDAQAIFLVPLLVQAQLRGSLIILTDSVLSDDSQGHPGDPQQGGHARAGERRPHRGGPSARERGALPLPGPELFGCRRDRRGRRRYQLREPRGRTGPRLQARARDRP